MSETLSNGKVLYLACPHGMCAGVRRALETMDLLLKHTAVRPVWVFHELIHNTRVVEHLRKNGVHFVESVAEVPYGARLLLSAHGVPAAVESEAKKRGISIIDGTCPLVKRLHRAAEAHHGILLLAGHAAHPEVVGILGRGTHSGKFVLTTPEEVAKLPDFPPETPLLLLSQTTFNAETFSRISELLQARYPALRVGPGVCYATAHRQQAVREAAAQTPLFLVIGSPLSSNSNRLCEIAREVHSKPFLIDRVEELPEKALAAAPSVGVSAGASAPEEAVREILTRLNELGFTRQVNVGGTREEQHFPPVPEA